MKTTPRKHQLLALERVKHDPVPFAWLMQMGTGKTWVALAEWEASNLRDLLVIAPAGSYGNWLRLDPDFPGEVQRHLSADVLTNQWVSGTTRRTGRERRLDQFLRDRSDRRRIFVVNVEALSTVKVARAAISRMLEDRQTMLVVDESTAIKNPKAKRTEFIVMAGQAAARRRIMTGLVTPRDPLDLYSQFEFLDWRILGHRSYWSFRARYAVVQKMLMGGRSVDIVVGYKNVEELQGKIAPHSYRVLKEECLDIPPKQYAIREVPLTKEQERIYRELKEHATTALASGGHVTATMVITQILRLHQVLCGYVVDEIGNVHAVPEHRTDELVEILEDHGGKAIVWIAYEYALLAVAQRLRDEFGPESVAIFYGGNRATRDEDERRWKVDPKCRFMLATAAAGGKGNTWVQADLVVYHSNTDNLEYRDQSEDRAHRDGQTKSVEYIDLLSPGTVDEKIVKSLRKKINMAAAITGENYREWLV